ncbi:Predicted DNA-binding transcriptional regulator YafY, contains an HTH and WYL domains [Paenibacillus algorifonticola]|uniref:Predicted DNA-binding transcriptional regulator YafY, contains an HTH and WYL domains n=1 Tax=Paenibacillus algorifonticola TaxID=684063 RepID=A0A1I2CRX8_9BACL|nr:YafY family protein [Paenibacillus algorifonticola]SFE71008.1 Predicted DNA-binding transcriptional regulator YafY, contains an HTH and WYL domains [Paenibacillus algorifonticola]
MNKTERLLSIVLELQRNKVLKAAVLAEMLEVSPRTIYRDVQVLSESGVPIIGATGLGYSLMNGYFLPPVSFTVDEAAALLIGAEFVEKRFDTAYSRSARSSRRKIEAVLTEPIRNEADRVRDNILLLHKENEPEIGKREKAYVAAIRTAMLESKKIRFEYHKRAAQANEKHEMLRTVAPFGLVLDEQNGWLLVAHCDLRDDIRHFRLSRIKELAITNETFQLPSSFHLHDYQPKDDRNVRVHVLFNASIADKVKIANNYYMEDAQLNADGYYVTFRVRRSEDLLSWLLGWGADVMIIEPEAFKIRIKKEIENMMKRY